MPAIMQNYYSPGAYNASDVVPWWYFGTWTIYTDGTRNAKGDTDFQRMSEFSLCPQSHAQAYGCTRKTTGTKKTTCGYHDVISDCVSFKDTFLFTSIDATNAALYNKTNTDISMGVDKFITSGKAILAACILAWIAVPFAHFVFTVNDCTNSEDSHCFDLVAGYIEISVFGSLFGLSVYILFACYYGNSQLVDADAWTALFPSCTITVTPTASFLGLIYYQIVSIGAYLIFLVVFELTHLSSLCKDMKCGDSMMNIYFCCSDMVCRKSPPPQARQLEMQDSGQIDAEQHVTKLAYSAQQLEQLRTGHRFATPKKNLQVDASVQERTSLQIFAAVRDNNISALWDVCVEWAGHELLNWRNPRQEDRTALNFAASKGHEQCAHVLICAGANLETKDNGDRGATALIVAAYWGRPNIVRLLIDEGANVHEPRRDGKTALILAKEQHQDDCVAILERALELPASSNVTISHSEIPLDLEGGGAGGGAGGGLHSGLGELSVELASTQTQQLLAPESSEAQTTTSPANTDAFASESPRFGSGRWKRAHIILPITTSLKGLHARVARMAGSSDDNQDGNANSASSPSSGASDV